MPAAGQTKKPLEIGVDVQQLLDGVLARSSHLMFVCLASVDGRLIGFATRADRNRGQRMAAVSCSLLALGETFAKEASAGPTQYNLIAAHGGAIVTVRVPSVSKRFALSLGADSEETVALALRSALDAAAAIGTKLP
jgi:predicted regulator of Ras-like GTPase activity (Roadblock/LC7/MglB family)